MGPPGDTSLLSLIGQGKGAVEQLGDEPKAKIEDNRDFYHREEEKQGDDSDDASAGIKQEIGAQDRRHRPTGPNSRCG